MAALAALILAAAPLAADPPAILVSRQLAARARLAVGDIVTLALDANGTHGRQFRVTGIYEPTPDPMRFTADRLEARLHLPDVIDIAADPQDPASREAVSAINVKLADAEALSRRPSALLGTALSMSKGRSTDGAKAQQFASELMARAPGVVVRQTARSATDDPFVVLDRFHVAISIVTMIAGTAFLLALMVIRAEERRETVGILRLVGISRRTLLASVAIEGLVVAALGAAFGIVLAYLSEGLVNRVFQARYDTALVFVRVTPSIAMRAIVVAAPLGILAGIGASWTLLRRDVLSILHR